MGRFLELCHKENNKIYDLLSEVDSGIKSRFRESEWNSDIFLTFIQHSCPTIQTLLTYSLTALHLQP